MKFLLRPNEISADLDRFVVVDARYRLNDATEGARLFREAHLPGARFVSLEDLSSEKTGRNGRHPWPSRVQLKNLFSRLGIGADTPVLAYDDSDHSGAGRLWAALRWMGHENAFVLDGGFHAWAREGLPLESGEAKVVAPADFPDRAPLLEIVTKDALDGRALFDARAPERYRGEVEPLDPRAGHIPGAKNLFYKTLLGEGGTFLPTEALAGLLPEGPSTFYCGSGVTATVPLLASHALGRPAALYAGSWSEYSADPAAPASAEKLGEAGSAEKLGEAGSAEKRGEAASAEKRGEASLDPAGLRPAFQQRENK